MELKTRQSIRLYVLAMRPPRNASLDACDGLLPSIVLYIGGLVNNLAEVLSRQGKYQEAEEMHGQVPPLGSETPCPRGNPLNRKL